jgi:hypothetical protein
MNERIHTLAEEAGLYCDGTPDAWDQEAIEKFAELIVMECAKTIQDFVDHRFPASEYPVRLKRYFGVKE